MTLELCDRCGHITDNDPFNPNAVRCPCPHNADRAAQLAADNQRRHEEAKRRVIADLVFNRKWSIAHGRARCPTCRRDIRINQFGNLRKHRTGPNLADPTCLGSGLGLEQP